jgi:hypothetical protein
LKRLAPNPGGAGPGRRRQSRAAPTIERTTTIFHHYTRQEGHVRILQSKTLLPSLKANNPKDARFGDGQ